MKPKLQIHVLWSDLHWSLQVIYKTWALLGEASQAQEGGRVGLVATEAYEESGRVFGVPAFEDVLLERCGGLLVEDSFLLEKLPRVSFENLSSKICVIA